MDRIGAWAAEVLGRGGGMTERILYKVNIDVVNGPRQVVDRALEVDAFDKLSVNVPVGTAGMKVELQPGAADQVRFLLITSKEYGSELTYTVNAADATPAYSLDEPHLLTGMGAVSMLDPAPESLFFNNPAGGVENAMVEILIGRDATP